MKALVFDAYGTLFDVFSVRAMCDRLFPGFGDVLAQRWRAKQIQYTLLRSLMGRYRDFWGLTEDALVHSAKALQLDLTAPSRAQLMESYLHLDSFPDVKPGLEQLAGLGLRLAILSNGTGRMLSAVVERAGIRDLLDAIISVDYVNIFKPSPHVYRLTTIYLNVDGSETGFVSSNNWDIHGAGSAGLRTFWIQRSGDEAPEELGYPATHVVGAITELAGRL